MTDKQININNNSDIGVTCSQCGTTFTGKGNYSYELIEMFVKHWRELHELTYLTEVSTPPESEEQ